MLPLASLELKLYTIPPVSDVDVINLVRRSTRARAGGTKTRKLLLRSLISGVPNLVTKRPDDSISSAGPAQMCIPRHPLLDPSC